jgi:CubicO group peptidase (beta-lactamase class C family)
LATVAEFADLEALIRAEGFSGVVRIDRAGEIVFARAYGFANRAYEVPNTLGTQFGLASGVKGLTALSVVSLIAEGRLDLATTARSVLGADLPLIADDVTVEHLLAHRSGIGDFLDEDDDYEITDYVMTVPAHELASTEDYLRVLGGHATKFAAGRQFSYSNGGFAVLALIAERVSGVPFPDLVRARVCAPAGMHDTAFLRSDELPGRAAIGYLAVDGLRSNVLHLPVRGSGEGGIYSTAADVHALWAAFFAGRIVSDEWVAEMVRPRSTSSESDSARYGLGFWLHATSAVVRLEGYDAGVSFRTTHDPATNLTHTVISNWSDGAWPVVRMLNELLGT